MKKSLQNLFPLLSLGLLPICSLIYDWVNHPGSEVHNLATTVDRNIPFSAVFIIPYLLWTLYIYGILIYFYFKDKKTYFKTLFVYIAGLLVCYTVYSLFQTTVPRPLVAGSSFLESLVNRVYEMDAPYNCFPSIHCFSSYLLVRVMRKAPFSTTWNRSMITYFSVIIIVSTLMVKQHVILDVFAAFLLAETLCFVSERNWSPSVKSKPIPSSTKEISH
ncbi:phosphatase PAP2 family protein [Fictibacillus sp. B-59209]|uniref:phosphatase PAP2 family protein n=1 Tax=Fictibacillus sp. B-59209 TaxID=3024873 RepID=UPI002E1A7E14|nr:phosphatase PAP2 family protein [Fictibacillus sp. B-59209]